MGRYIARRVLQFIPVLLGTLFLVHYLTVLGIQFSGDPIRALFGARQPSESVLMAMREKFNLDSPCLDQPGNPCFGLFFERVVDYLHGDFGVTFQNEPVTEVLGRRFPVTVRVVIIALIAEAIIGIGAGILSGLRKDGPADYTVRGTSTLLVAVPVFVLGVLVQIASGVYIGGWIRDQDWAPEWLQSIFSITYNGDDPWLSLLVPGIVLGAFSIASISRLTRTSLIENYRADFVRTARAKGLTEGRVIGVHTLRNSLIPVVTYIGIDAGFLINGAIVTEGIFNIPGVGGLTFDAATSQASAIIIPIATILVLLFMVANLLVDISYAVLDPRIRYD